VASDKPAKVEPDIQIKSRREIVIVAPLYGLVVRPHYIQLKFGDGATFRYDRPMLLVVSPNLALDRILEVQNFRAAEVQRTQRVIVQPGGKGSNVARVFRQLGGDVVLVGFVGRRDAARVREPLLSLGVQVETVEAFESSRTCTIVRDVASHEHPTVINEESPPIDSRVQQALIATVDEWLPRATALLVTGSLSSGLPADFYRTMLRRAAEKIPSLLTAVDASGEVLNCALGENPTLAKANLQEWKSAIGVTGADAAELVRSVRQRGKLPSQVIVTLGETGALLVAGDDAWFAKPPRISRVNPIGAGDSFAAGYLKARMEGMSLEVALATAVAVAASDAETAEPGNILAAEIPLLISRTVVTRLQ
jgi:1-phosphofructokinase family hexose kinase